MSLLSKKTESGEEADDDKEILSRVRAGEKNAYRVLVERYEKRIRSVAYGVIGNPSDAEEIAQEAFIKAYKNLKSFRGQSSFYTWLYRITFNLAIDASRKRYRSAETSIADQGIFDAISNQGQESGKYMAKISSPEREYERAQISQKIKGAIEELSPDHRAVIMFREIQGLSYQEISEVLKCSKGTVMSRLHHARKKLQVALSELRPGSEENE